MAKFQNFDLGHFDSLASSFDHKYWFNDNAYWICTYHFNIKLIKPAILLTWWSYWAKMVQLLQLIIMHFYPIASPRDKYGWFYQFNIKVICVYSICIIIKSAFMIEWWSQGVKMLNIQFWWFHRFENFKSEPPDTPDQFDFIQIIIYSIIKRIIIKYCSGVSGGSDKNFSKNDFLMSLTRVHPIFMIRDESLLPYDGHIFYSAHKLH